MRLRFGVRTVPALKLDGGEKVSGSRAIMRKLDELVPDPPLLPPADDPARPRRGARGRALGRRGAAAARAPARVGRPEAPPGRDPELPGGLAAAAAAAARSCRLVAPGVIAIERRMNGACDDAVRADLRALPGHLDRVDGWIAAGVLGGGRRPAQRRRPADRRLAAAARHDRRRAAAARRAARRGARRRRLFPDFPGDVPAGACPPGWLPRRLAAGLQRPRALGELDGRGAHVGGLRRAARRTRRGPRPTGRRRCSSGRSRSGRCRCRRPTRRRARRPARGRSPAARRCGSC